MDNKTALFNRTNLQMNNETELQEVKIKNKMLKNTVAALTDKLKASKGADSTHVQKMDRKISLIEKEKNHLNDLVKELKNEVRTQKETLKVVDERSEQQGTSNELVAQLESEVAILEKIQKRSESRNNELEDILLKKEKRIHNLETNLDLVSVSLRNLSNEVGSKKQEISLLEKEIETLNEEKQLGDDERVGMQERIRELWITMESKKVKSRDANTS
jgi:chromosome segregation ATPase